MGCESSPDLLVRSVFELLALSECPFSLTIFCTEEFSTLCSSFSCPTDVTFVTTPSAIEMNDDPLSILRKKRDSSLFAALESLREHTIDALITCGNTGALLAGAYHLIETVEKIKRPALVALMPTKKHPVAVLDVGANVTCDSTMLVQFAVMGRAYQQARGIKEPTIGILNIGSEETKGRKELQEAYSLLEKTKESLSFVGNIEGREAFDGTVDVLITDGFTGNIFLKTAEGVSSFILSQLEESVQPYDAFEHLEKITNYAEYPGALLCGLNELVIKCHGASNGLAVKNGLFGAYQLLNQGFLESLRKKLSFPS